MKFWLRHEPINRFFALLRPFLLCSVVAVLSIIGSVVFAFGVVFGAMLLKFPAVFQMDPGDDSPVAAWGMFGYIAMFWVVGIASLPFFTWLAMKVARHLFCGATSSPGEHEK